MPNKIPSGIARGHIVAAIRDLDRGARHAFGESTGYDVLFEGRRYAPKAVIGLAAGKISGTPLGPYDFKGGLKSKCFRILEANGFTIITKGETHPFPDEVVRRKSIAKGQCSVYWSTAMSETRRLAPKPSNIMGCVVRPVALILRPHTGYLARDSFTYTIQCRCPNSESPMWSIPSRISDPYVQTATPCFTSECRHTPSMSCEKLWRRLTLARIGRFQAGVADTAR